MHGQARERMGADTVLKKSKGHYFLKEQNILKGASFGRSSPEFLMTSYPTKAIDEEQNTITISP